MVVYRIAADGSAYDLFPIDDPGMHPDIAYARDRVAVAWVRTEFAEEGRYLSLLRCDP